MLFIRQVGAYGDAPPEKADERVDEAGEVW